MKSIDSVPSLDTKDVGAILKIGTDRVRFLVKSGRLKAVVVTGRRGSPGCRYRFAMRDVNNYLLGDAIPEAREAECPHCKCIHREAQ